MVKTQNNKRVYLIGIGGIGMSSLARYYLSEGFMVSGSDIVSSPITEELEGLGVKIFCGPHKASHIPRGSGFIVHTAALRKDNLELKEGRKRKYVIRTYAEALGELTKNYFTIAVAGAHGKSTTTAMVAKVLIEGGLDPTVIIGTRLKDSSGADGKKDTNFRKGNSKYLIVEADEYAGSFLNYHPDIAVLTNIDEEHLDFYKTKARIVSAFKKFLTGSKPGAVFVLNNDNQDVLKLGLLLSKLKRFSGRFRWYSLRNSAVEDIKYRLQVPGIHNVSNALAAYCVGQTLKIPNEKILKALSEYGGVWRRFEYKGTLNGAKIFDDYAHHPTEIKATLEAARDRYPKHRIWCVFQPHQQARLSRLFERFVPAFDCANELVLLDPYEVPGREKPRSRRVNASSFRLAAAVDARLKNNVYYISYSSQIPEFLARYVGMHDIVIMMGAGDIWKLTGKLV